MATACLFVGWDRAAAGREAEAWKFISGEAKERIEKYQKEGFIEGYDLVGLTAHGGDLNAFYLLYGERAKLDELRRTDEFEKFSMKFSTLVTGYGVIPGVTRQGIQKVIDRNPDVFK